MDKSEGTMYDPRGRHVTPVTGRYVQETLDGVWTGKMTWKEYTPEELATMNRVKVGVFVGDVDETMFKNLHEPVRLVPSDKLEWNIAHRLLKLYDLFKQRQRKYGPGNIAAFADKGIVVRASDKLARLKHAYFEGGALDMADESVRDAWADLAVYAIIALVCMDGAWPGVEATAEPEQNAQG